MFRVKTISLLVLICTVSLSSCTPGTDIPQQVATIVSNTFTQTALPPATSTPNPGEATLPVGSDAVSTPITVMTDTPQSLPAVATVSPPIVEYSNSAVGYRLNLPGDWVINETNSSNKEVIFSPPNAESFISYLSVSLDSRTLDQVINSYSQNYPDAIRGDTMFYGYPTVKYTFAGGRNEYFIPYGNQLFLIATDRPGDGMVQSILMTFRFMTPPAPVTHDATMADNGRTFVMNIGDKLRLNLDLNYEWSAVSISDPAVLAGAGDGYFAFTHGTAILTTTGNPGCLALAPPCAMPSIMYTVTVIVR